MLLIFLVQLALVQATAAAIAGSASLAAERPVTDRTLVLCGLPGCEHGSDRIPRPLSVAWFRDKFSAIDPHARHFCSRRADAEQLAELLSTEALRDMTHAVAEMMYAEKSAWRAMTVRLAHLSRGLEDNKRRDRETGRLCRSRGRRTSPAEYHNLEHEESERLEAADEQADQSCAAGRLGRTTPAASGFPAVSSIKETEQEIRRLTNMRDEARGGRERWADLHKRLLGFLRERSRPDHRAEHAKLQQEYEEYIIYHGGHLAWADFHEAACLMEDRGFPLEDSEVEEGGQQRRRAGSPEQADGDGSDALLQERFTSLHLSDGAMPLHKYESASADAFRSRQHVPDAQRESDRPSFLPHPAEAEERGARDRIGAVEKEAVSAAEAFLRTKGIGEAFCVLHAKTEQIIGATKEWQEKAGITWDDAMAANHGGAGIRGAVADLRAEEPPLGDQTSVMLTATTTGGNTTSPQTTTLKEFLDRPGDTWTPTLDADSGLFLNTRANDGAPVVQFLNQWHNKGRFRYVGLSALSRLLCQDEDGKHPVAYLLDLRDVSAAPVAMTDVDPAYYAAGVAERWTTVPEAGGSHTEAAGRSAGRADIRRAAGRGLSSLRKRQAAALQAETQIPEVGAFDEQQAPQKQCLLGSLRPASQQRQTDTSARNRGPGRGFQQRPRKLSLSRVKTAPRSSDASATPQDQETAFSTSSSSPCSLRFPSRQREDEDKKVRILCGLVTGTTAEAAEALRQMTGVIDDAAVLLLDAQPALKQKLWCRRRGSKQGS